MTRHLILLHPDAPPKPAVGEACNRCGVCCAAETCPLGRLVFRQKAGPCPALAWTGDGYACELVVVPERHLRFLRILPHALSTLANHLFKRWIAVGSGCDSNVDVLNSRGIGDATRCK